MKATVSIAFLVSGSLIMVSACRSTDISDAKVTNGVEISDEEYPFVKHFGGCTATALSSTVMLTAAHCVTSENYTTDAIPDILGGKYQLNNYHYSVDAVRGYMHPAGGDFAGPGDLAVGIFPKNTFNNWATIRANPIQKNDPITMVGFGNNDNVNETGSGRKRKGTNRLGGRLTGGMNPGMLFVGGNAEIIDESGEDSLTGKGDSGSALFAGSSNELVGVTSGGGIERAIFVDIHGRPAKLFFLYLERLGLDITLPDGFLDDVKNIPYGIYEDTADPQCKAYVAGEETDEETSGITLQGCPDVSYEYLTCSTTTCKSDFGIALKNFQYKSFTLSVSGAPDREFAFFEDATLQQDINSSGEAN
ncbi:MAG: trypsin-like serine protease [Oligoflexales bacterium]